MPLPWDATAVSCFISEKSEVKAAASICGMAAFVAGADVLGVAEGVVDELHAEAETASPSESNALVRATDLLAVPIDFSFHW
jgi:hypothetical protein